EHAVKTSTGAAQTQDNTLGKTQADWVGVETTDGPATGLTGLSTNIAQLQDVLDRVHAGAGRGTEGSELMHEAANRLTTSTGDLVDAAQELSDAISTAADASSELSTGLESLSEGAKALQ